MNRYCSVPYCNSWSKRNPEIPFHLFPKADKNKVCMDTKFGTKYLIDRQKAWILKLGIGKPVTKFMRVCSLHFTQDDYFHRGNNSKRNILKKTAVPSRKLPLQVPCEPRPSRIEKCSRRSAKYILNIPENSSDCTDKDSQHTKRDHVAGQGLRKLLLSRPNYTGPKKFCNFQRQSAPNPTNSGQSVDNIKFCDRTGLWVTPLSRPTDFSIKSVPNSCESPNVAPKVLKERQIGSTHHDVEDFNNTNDNTENSNNLPKIESSSLEDNLPKITNVFSLSESEFVQNDFTGCEAVQDVECVNDDNLNIDLPKDNLRCSFKESKLSCSISEIITDVDNATDGFAAAKEIKDEPVDVEINRVPLVDNTISDEETADASETASYMQDIIDSIPEINDSNQYVDIPEFVQINNFGPKDLEEFRRQQLKEKEREENEEGSSSVNELSPDTPSSIPDMNFSDSVFVNGNRMVRYGDEYKLASQADKTPLLKNMLCPVRKTSVGIQEISNPNDTIDCCEEVFKKLPEVIVFEGKEYIKSYERNAYIPHPNQEQEVGTSQKCITNKADCGPKRKRRFKIVPVSDTSQSGKIGVKSNKEKRDPKYDKDVVVLYTSYTTDAYYINDHDYLVNPYKRNKVLINENNGWLCMCYICHQKHAINSHISHMNQHNAKCKICVVDMGTPYMLNVHARSHNMPCPKCTQHIPYGLIESHAYLHYTELKEVNNSSWRKTNKEKKMPEPVTTRDSANESVPEEPSFGDTITATGRGRGRKRTYSRKKDTRKVGKRVLRPNTRKSYNEADVIDKVSEISEIPGPP